MVEEGERRENTEDHASAGERTLRFFGLKRNVSLLLLMLVLVGLGEKLFQRFLPRYLRSEERRGGE